MPSLIDLRRRIRAVKNTQQITKAMKMVAASKLRRAQERMMLARPYATQMQRVLGSLATRVDPSIHPLLAVRDATSASKSLVIVVTADKGLCGSFNTNIIKAAGAYIVDSTMPCTLGLVGRKGRDFFGRRGFDVFFEQVGIFQKLKFDDARSIAQTAIEAFTSGHVDRVILAYNEFKSVISQRIVIDQLLPIARADVEGTSGTSGTSGTVGTLGTDYIYEPSPQAIFNDLLPRYVEVQVYRALLESNAAFFAAQMTAMDTATKNSADMISSLTLYMNKVRQAAITREIIEVVSGAEAL
ncbi:MAG TPA: ATP synthase F1 subunit gamma [Vicinamibacterales bacterium]|nr:ATP synthase F1 subunit gamma [Vicinamibacterales bacterium]